MEDIKKTEIEAKCFDEEKKQVKIMFVDDCKADLMLAEKIFQFFKWNYMIFSNAGEALLVSKVTHFDIIFSDINMPETGGLELVSYIRNDPENANFKTPIIIISGVDVDESFDFLSNSNLINEFISKPYSVEKFNEIVIKHVLKPR